MIERVHRVAALVSLTSSRQIIELLPEPPSSLWEYLIEQGHVDENLVVTDEGMAWLRGALA